MGEPRPDVALSEQDLSNKRAYPSVPYGYIYLHMVPRGRTDKARVLDPYICVGTLDRYFEILATNVPLIMDGEGCAARTTGMFSAAS